MSKQIVPIEQKLINFEGADILGVKANDGKIYVGVRWVVDGIGFTRGQANNQIEKVQTDAVLKSGSSKFVFHNMGGKGGTQEVMTIELDYLPLWLAKITITPNMIENTPEVAENLVSYQLKAKDVLARAFLQQSPSYMIEDQIERAERWIEETREKKALEAKALQLAQQMAEYEPRISYLDHVLKCIKTLTTSQIAADYDMSAKALNVILHEERVQRKVNKQWILYADHQGNGYTKSETIAITRSNGDPDVTLNTRWTQKGRLFIHEILKKQGILPVMER